MFKDQVVNRDRALRNTHPTVVTNNGGKDVWDEDGNVIVLDESKIATELARLQEEYDNNKYQRDREFAYPSIQDQLDDLYHNGIDGWKSTIKTTKDKYPKG